MLLLCFISFLNVAQQPPPPTTAFPTRQCESAGPLWFDLPAGPGETAERRGPDAPRVLPGGTQASAAAPTHRAIHQGQSNTTQTNTTTTLTARTESIINLAESKYNMRLVSGV